MNRNYLNFRNYEPNHTMSILLSTRARKNIINNKEIRKAMPPERSLQYSMNMIIILTNMKTKPKIKRRTIVVIQVHQRAVVLAVVVAVVALVLHHRGLNTIQHRIGHQILIGIITLPSGNIAHLLLIFHSNWS